MVSKRFLDIGSPLVTKVMILKKNQMIKITNPEKLSGDTLRPGALGRIHSVKNNLYTVWLLDETTMNTIIIEIPTHLMGQYFKQHAHSIFPHLG